MTNQERLKELKNLKKRLGVIASTVLLTNALAAKPVYAKTYQKEGISLEYILDSNHDNEGAKDISNQKLVSITDANSGYYVVITMQQFNQALEKSNDDIVKINELTFDKKTILELKEKIESDDAKYKEIEEKQAEERKSAAITALSIAGVGLGLKKIYDTYVDNGTRRQYRKAR